MGAMASGKIYYFLTSSWIQIILPHDDKLGFIYIHIYINIDKSKALFLNTAFHILHVKSNLYFYIFYAKWRDLWPMISIVLPENSQKRTRAKSNRKVSKWKRKREIAIDRRISRCELACIVKNMYLSYFSGEFRQGTDVILSN